MVVYIQPFLRFSLLFATYYMHYTALIQLRFSHYPYHSTFTFHIIRTEKG